MRAVEKETGDRLGGEHRGRRGRSLIKSRMKEKGKNGKERNRNQ